MSVWDASALQRALKLKEQARREAELDSARQKCQQVWNIVSEPANWMYADRAYYATDLRTMSPNSACAPILRKGEYFVDVPNADIDDVSAQLIADTIKGRFWRFPSGGIISFIYCLSED